MASRACELANELIKELKSFHGGSGRSVRLYKHLLIYILHQQEHIEYRNKNEYHELNRYLPTITQGSQNRNEKTQVVEQWRYSQSIAQKLNLLGPNKKEVKKQKQEKKGKKKSPHRARPRIRSLF